MLADLIYDLLRFAFELTFKSSIIAETLGYFITLI